MKIMIVEDEVIIAISLKMDLETEDLQITGIAARYEEALALLKKEKPDLVLCDINLKSEKDGIDVATWINNYDKNIKIIFMNGYGFDVVGDRLKNVSFQQLIEKPVEASDLKPIIEYNFPEPVTK
jgi:two-component SAPR family response regulator